MSAAFAVSVSLVGCGGGDGSTTGTDRPAATTTPATDGPTATPEPSPGAELSPQGLISAMVAAMEEHRTVHIEMELGSAVSAVADMRYPDGDEGVAMDMTMTMGPMEQRVIFIDDAVYVQQPGGEGFMRLGADDPMFGGLMDQVRTMGPEASLKALEHVDADVEDLGTEQVGGEKLHRYRFTADAAGLAELSGELAGLGQVGGAETDLLPDRISYDMWIDRDHLLRVMEMEVMGQTVRMEANDWGEPVTISAPKVLVNP